MYEGKIARSATKILGYAGTMTLMGGGLRIFLMGVPPSPPMSDNPVLIFSSLLLETV